MKTENVAAQTDNSALARFAADLALKGAEPTVLLLSTGGEAQGLTRDVPVIFDRSAQRAISVKALVEEYRTRPERRTGTAKVNTLSSLIELTKRHATDIRSALFAERRWPKPAITAVIDYHAVDGTPGWQKHRVHYDFPLTDEFKVWIEGNGKAMKQGDFARFLEEHAAEMVSPDAGEVAEYERLFKERFATPAEVMTLARELEVFVGHHVKRVERPKSGERTAIFVEEQTNSKGEAVDIPGIFMVAVQAFMDGGTVRIPARLRYRVTGGEIVWFYDLYRWEFWLRNQVVSDLDKAAKETGLPAFEGQPEVSA
jgi:uncharacterized protein YfdQ (DUF2303 family)